VRDADLTVCESMKKFSNYFLISAIGLATPIVMAQPAFSQIIINKVELKETRDRLELLLRTSNNQQLQSFQP